MDRPLRAVFFDVDDTLVPTTEFAQQARRAAVEAMCAAGLDHPRAEVLRELGEVVKEFSSNYGRHFDKLLLRVPPESFEGVNPALIIAAGVVAYHDTKHNELSAYPDALALLEHLAGTDRLVGVITAGWEIKQAEKLIRLGIVPLLAPHAIFISDQIGISKPNPKLYARACAAVGVPPDEAMYIGDNPTADIAPAASIGMVTVRVRRGKHADASCPTAPDYTIDDFAALRDILVDRFGLALPRGPLVAATPGAPAGAPAGAER